MKILPQNFCLFKYSHLFLKYLNIFFSLNYNIFPLFGTSDNVKSSEFTTEHVSSSPGIFSMQSEWLLQIFALVEFCWRGLVVPWLSPWMNSQLPRPVQQSQIYIWTPRWPDCWSLRDNSTHQSYSLQNKAARISHVLSLVMKISLII